MRMSAQTDDFRALYASNQRLIRALLNRMVGPQDAEDLVQVTFPKAAQGLADFRNASDVSTWLHRMNQRRTRLAAQSACPRK